MTNPLKNPKAYNAITLDGEVSPGLCERKSGGNRKQKVDIQMAPGFAGWFTLFKGWEVSRVTYQFILWRDEHFDAWKKFHAMLKAGADKRPPRVYKLVDLNVNPNGITKVAVEELGARERIAPTKWAHEVTFLEFKKKKPTGGLPKEPKTQNQKDFEAKVASLDAERKTLQAQLAKLEADRKK